MTDELSEKILVRIMRARDDADVDDPRRCAMIYAVALDDIAGIIEGSHRWTLVRAEDICPNPDRWPVHAPRSSPRDCQACRDAQLAKHER
jgi:hypothetical protein